MLKAMNPQNMSMEDAQKFLTEQARGGGKKKHGDSSNFIKEKKEQV